MVNCVKTLIPTSPISGISIIICCYNSSKRLQPTLEHVQRLKIREGLSWEVIVIDNASTDNTSEHAQRIWNQDAVTELKTIKEETPGLSHARHRGLKESRYDVLAFIDDDNWVSPDWLEQVQIIFESDATIAAAGGPIEEVCEAETPEWFERFKGNFTIWIPQPKASYFEKPLCGAGLCIRKQAWMALIEHGFQSRLVDRQGANLSSGGDFELCYALLIAGHKLWYDPKLLVKHFMPQSRITWPYLKKLNEGFGQQSIYFEPYDMLFNHQPKQLSWKKERMAIYLHLLKHLPWLLGDCFGLGEGSEKILFIRGQIGRLKALLKERETYNDSYKHLKEAQWVSKPIEENAKS